MQGDQSRNGLLWFLKFVLSVILPNLMNKKRFYGQSNCHYCYYLNIYLQSGLHMFLEIKQIKNIAFHASFS